MGAFLSLATGLRPSTGAVYGLPSFLGGWVAHLADSPVFASAHLVYGAVPGTVFALASRSVPGPTVDFRRASRS
jgi:hypothetical protein